MFLFRKWLWISISRRSWCSTPALSSCDFFKTFKATIYLVDLSRAKYTDPIYHVQEAFLFQNLPETIAFLCELFLHAPLSPVYECVLRLSYRNTKNQDNTFQKFQKLRLLLSDATTLLYPVNCCELSSCLVRECGATDFFFFFVEFFFLFSKPLGNSR